MYSKFSLLYATPLCSSQVPILVPAGTYCIMLGMESINDNEVHALVYSYSVTHCCFVTLRCLCVMHD